MRSFAVGFVLLLISTATSAFADDEEQSPQEVVTDTLEDDLDAPVEVVDFDAFGDPVCNELGVSYPVERVWMRADYLLWWLRGNQMPPLVTSSPPGTPRDEAGVLGHASTRVLLGGRGIDDSSRDGGRITAGFWLWGAQETGVEVSWFSVDDGDSTHYMAASSGTPILARPFFNVGTGMQDSQLVAYPDVVDGQIEIATSSNTHSAGIVVRHLLRGGPSGRLDFLIGYRHMSYDEDLQISEDLFSTDPGGLIQQGTRFAVREAFRTENNFHGGDLGLALQRCSGSWGVDATAKIAVGGIHRQLGINGSTTVTVPGVAPVTSPGGLLASGTNIGTYESSDVAILPEFDVNLQYSWTQDVTLSMGYSFMLLTGVLRTGNELDLVVDQTVLPSASNVAVAGVGRPEVQHDDTTIWLQGLSFGVELRR